MPVAEQRVGEYILQERIGAGTFGEVWRARHHVWADQVAAVKIPTDPSYVRNLQREGSTVHGLTHPNIVRPFALDPFAPVPYLVMEYVPGSNLRKYIKERSLTIAQSIDVLERVLSALSYAHGRGVVHRDVKPENVLVHEDAPKLGFSADGMVKLTDFGVGQAATDSARQSIAFSASLQGAAEIAGTLDYMSPEQRAGETVDGRSDIWACGVMLYEMLTGERPAGTELPSALNEQVPAYLDDAFRRSYARLDRRFESADAFVAALRKSAPPPLPAKPANPVNRMQHGATCPACRKGVGKDDQFCIHCGVQLLMTVRRCPKCSSFPDAHDQYCIFCGTEISSTVAAG